MIHGEVGVNSGRVTLKIIFQIACRIKEGGGGGLKPPIKIVLPHAVQIEILPVVGISYMEFACKISGKLRAFYGHSGQFSLWMILIF